MRVVLLLLVAAHYAYNMAADWIGSTPPRVFYIFQGLSGLVLAVVVAISGRDWISRGLALLLAAEQALVAGCGSLDLYAVAPSLGPMEGIRDAHGVHTYRIGVVALAWFAFMLAFKLHKEKHERSTAPGS